MPSIKSRKSDASAVEQPPDVIQHGNKPKGNRGKPTGANKNTGQEKQHDTVQGGGGGSTGGGGKQKRTSGQAP